MTATQKQTHLQLVLSASAKKGLTKAQLKKVVGEFGYHEVKDDCVALLRQLSAQYSERKADWEAYASEQRTLHDYRAEHADYDRWKAGANRWRSSVERLLSQIKAYGRTDNPPQSGDSNLAALEQRIMARLDVLERRILEAL